jgi:hypothetical protein
LSITARAGADRELARAATGEEPDMARAIRRQQRVAALLQSGGPGTPGTLHVRIDRLYQEQHSSLRPRVPALRPRWTSTAAASAVAVAIGALVLAISGSRTLTATQIASTWKRPSIEKVSPDPANPAVLDVAFHGTSYPNYQDSEGWHPVGARADLINNTPALTVYYATGPRRSAYTVVAGRHVSVPAGAHRFVVNGVRLAEFRQHDHWIIVFPNHGNTCVLTAEAPREQNWLVKLAVWQRDGASTRI